MDKKKAEKGNMGLELCLWTVLCVGAMAVMLLFAYNKPVVIADTPSDLSGNSNFAKENEGLRGNALILDRTLDEKGCFRIPLPKDVKAEDVAMENCYTEGELWLCIKSEETGFYENNALSGDTSIIREGSSGAQEGNILLRLKMQRVMEYRSTLEGDALVVSYYEPGELYDHIVVLDPLDSGDKAPAGENVQDRDVTLAIAGLVQKNLSLEGVKIYLTRTDDRALSEEGRLALIDQVGADIYVGIDVSSEQDDPDKYGILCYYNDDYFIPGLENVSLADMAARETATASSNRALGLLPAGKNSLLRRIEIPAAQLSVGYLSNTQESLLLGQESYQEKLAEGILAALAKACRELEGVEAAKAAE